MIRIQGPTYFASRSGQYDAAKLPFGDLAAILGPNLEVFGWHGPVGGWFAEPAIPPRTDRWVMMSGRQCTGSWAEWLTNRRDRGMAA